MESFMKSSNAVKGIEVLRFDEAEVEKYKGTYEAFGAIGSLSVLYYKDYNRFVLQINDWKYPLLKRLPMFLTSDRTDTSHRTYVFPALNGFTFQLKVFNIPNVQALINFETILSHNSLFAFKGEDISERKRETSPDDKLVRHHTKDTGAKEIITENVKSVIHKVKAKAATMTSGTKYLTSTKKRIDMSKIKNKDFRKNAKSSFSTNFFKSNQKLASEFSRLGRENKNMTEAKDLSQLMKTSNAPAHYIFREDLEEAILKNKDLVIQGNFMPLEKEKKGFFENLKESVQNIKEMATVKKNELIGGSRAVAQNIKEEKLHEVSTHHSEA